MLQETKADVDSLAFPDGIAAQPATFLPNLPEQAVCVVWLMLFTIPTVLPILLLILFYWFHYILHLQLASTVTVILVIFSSSWLLPTQLGNMGAIPKLILESVYRYFSYRVVLEKKAGLDSALQNRGNRGQQDRVAKIERKVGSIYLFGKYFVDIFSFFSSFCYIFYFILIPLHIYQLFLHCIL